MAGTKANKDSIRTFICIEIPDSIKSRIDKLQTSLKQIPAKVSWTKPTSIHLTVKFLGAVEASRIPRVCKAVERAAESIKCFEIEIGGAGCFPSPRNPRVLWIGFSEVPDALQQLYEHIEDELAQKGFEREKQKFSPHLTIGRLRTPDNGQRLAETLIETGFEAESIRADAVIVMRSDLRPTGSIYTPQCVINLL